MDNTQHPSQTNNCEPLPGDKDWVDCGTYWLNINNQDTDGWKSARRVGWGHTKSLLTASNFGMAAGHSPFHKFIEVSEVSELPSSPTEYIYKKTFTPEQEAHMKRGKKLESTARNHYENITGNKVIEVGLAIPKFDIRIGASVDGLISNDGCLEIKCGAKMYPKLTDPAFANEHPSKRIYQTHYDQMIGEMVITNRSWCDYCVYTETPSIQIYIERVPFDYKYWNEELYPKLLKFMSYNIAIK